MPVALLKNFDEAIISQAYPVFEVINENKVLISKMAKGSFEKVKDVVERKI